MPLQREHSVQLCVHGDAPTQPSMQERALNSYLRKEIKEFHVEMQIYCGFDCHGSVPIKRFPSKVLQPSFASISFREGG